MKSLELSEAQGHWKLGENWIVTDGEGNELWEFPEGMDERKVMSSIRLGRKFELKAFNLGVDFGKEEQKKIHALLIQDLENRVRSLEAMNVELSNQLEAHIEGN